MSGYTDHAGFEWVGGTRYRNTKTLAWHIGHRNGPLFIVEPGFKFDVSVPRWLWWLVNPHRLEYLKAAALHDKMLTSTDQWSRGVAAAVFYEALKADGVGRARRMIMFLAVILWTVR